MPWLQAPALLTHRAVAHTRFFLHADVLLFAVVADISILTLNLSLMINTVSFYQIAKLLIIPCVCFIERFYMGRRFTREVTAAILVVISGVAIV